MKPVLIIGGVDYSKYVEELTPTDNDLDADGSGRDVQSGLMYRTKITTKQTWVVKMLDLPEDTAKTLRTAIKAQYYTAKVLDPNTNTVVTKTFYTSTVPFGAQKFRKGANKTVYSGMEFSMIER